MAIDQKWVGANRANNFFFVMLDPGPHYLHSVLDGTSLLSFAAEAGKTYYLQQKISMGGIDRELLDKDEGKKDLAKADSASRKKEIA